MIVVSDTSPITSLITIRRIDLLRELFETVLIPPAVERELLAFHNALPPFIRMDPALDIATLRWLRPLLDEGEAEAIALAKMRQPDWLLMDETKGRASPKAKACASSAWRVRSSSRSNTDSSTPLPKFSTHLNATLVSISPNKSVQT